MYIAQQVKSAPVFETEHWTACTTHFSHNTLPRQCFNVFLVTSITLADFQWPSSLGRSSAGHKWTITSSSCIKQAGIIKLAEQAFYMAVSSTRQASSPLDWLTAFPIMHQTTTQYVPQHSSYITIPPPPPNYTWHFPLYNSPRLYLTFPTVHHAILHCAL